MVAILTILAHKIAIQLHLVAESCTICSSCAPGGQSGNFWIHPPYFDVPCYVGSCYHGTTRPPVAGGEDGLQTKEGRCKYTE
jgi:hypothetical protein